MPESAKSTLPADTAMVIDDLDVDYLDDDDFTDEPTGNFGNPGRRG